MADPYTDWGPYVDNDGRAYASLQEYMAHEVLPSLGGATATPLPAVFSRAGSLAVETGSGRFLFTRAVAIVGVRAIVNTAPVGASIILDVNKNGTTIFSTQANRPTIAAGSNLSSNTLPDVTALTSGDYLTVDIDQIGSTTPGADLTVLVEYTVV